MDQLRQARINRHLGELRRLLETKPALAVRTHDLLAGTLPCPELEAEEMTERELQSARIPADMMERAEALVPVLKEVPELAAFGRVTKSAVVRLALFKGLQILEQEYGKKGGRKRK